MEFSLLFAKHIIIIIVTLIWFLFKLTISKILQFLFSFFEMLSKAELVVLFQHQHQQQNNEKENSFQPQKLSVLNNRIFYCFSYVSQYIQQLGYPLNANISTPFYVAFVILQYENKSSSKT